MRYINAEYKVAIVYTASTGEQAITQTNIVQFDDGDDRPGWFWFLVIGLPLICTCLILTALVLLILAAVIRRMSTPHTCALAHAPCTNLTLSL
jgi:hypothetical protein